MNDETQAAQKEVPSLGQSLTQILHALQRRLGTRPAWYQWILTHDDTRWWVTPFTYEQIEGNRKDCLRLVNSALALPIVNFDRPTSEVLGKLQAFCTDMENQRDSLRSEIETLRWERELSEVEQVRKLLGEKTFDGLCAVLRQAGLSSPSAETQAAQKEVTSLGQSDTERLDWLECRDRACLELRYQPRIGMMEENQVIIHKSGIGNIAVAPNFRSAIDAARGLPIVSTSEPQSTASALPSLESLQRQLDDEQERHAQLQSRCYEGYPTVSDGIFDAYKESQHQLTEALAACKWKDEWLDGFEDAIEDALDNECTYGSDPEGSCSYCSAVTALKASARKALFLQPSSTALSDYLREETKELVETLQGIADADWRKWDAEVRSETDFVSWAKSRASHTLARFQAASKDSESHPETITT